MHSPTRPLNTKLLLVILILITGVTLISGCLNEKRQSENSQNVQVKDETKKENMNIAVYYVKYTPDDAYLVREVHTIPYTGEPLRAAVEELIKAKPETEGAINIIPHDTRVLDVKVENATAIVNFSEEVLNTNVGSEGEILGIQSIVNTLTEFPDVEKVSFQVEGKVDGRARDWWGHVGLYDQPFKRDISKVHEPAIWIIHPQQDQVVGVPMLVKGSARVWEGKISVQLVDSNNKILAQKHITATKSAPERGDFEMSIKFDPPKGDKGRVEVYGKNPDNGSELIKVTVPVKWP